MISNADPRAGSSSIIRAVSSMAELSLLNLRLQRPHRTIPSPEASACLSSGSISPMMPDYRSSLGEESKRLELGLSGLGDPYSCWLEFVKCHSLDVPNLRRCREASPYSPVSSYARRVPAIAVPNKQTRFKLADPWLNPRLLWIDVISAKMGEQQVLRPINNSCRASFRKIFIEEVQASLAEPKPRIFTSRDIHNTLAFLTYRLLLKLPEGKDKRSDGFPHSRFSPFRRRCMLERSCDQICLEYYYCLTCTYFAQPPEQKNKKIRLEGFRIFIDFACLSLRMQVVLKQ